MPRPRKKPPAPAAPDLGDPGLDPGCQGTPVERRLDAKLRKQEYWFDDREADRACRFFEEELRHVEAEWAGRPIILEPWQRRLIRRLFGWRRPDGTRRYRRCHVWIPKKNGKSLLVSGICLYALACDGEPTPHIYCCAANEEQAQRQLFFNAREMVRASPTLDECCEIFKKSIFCQATGGRFEVVSSKPESKHGLSIHVVAYDEIHAARDRELYGVMTMGSGSARRQPLELVISTAGDDLASIGYELWEYGCRVRDGILEDPEFLVLIYAADPEDDWRDPAVWARVNPNYPMSPKHDILVSDMRRAEGLPGEVAKFKRLHLNIWTQAEKAAIDITRWKRCERKDLVARGSLIIPAKLEGKKCWGGVDLSSTNDLTSFALAFPREGNLDGVDILVWHWMPEDNIAERARRHRVDYPKWVAAKRLFATPGNVVDYTRVEDFIVRVAESVDLQDVGYDPRNATDFVQRMQDNRGITMVELLQNFKNLSPATKELERLYLSRRLGHNGDPVLTWQASHVIWKSNPSGDIMPDKKKSREKIDGIAALVMALSRCSLGKANVSVFESRGVIIL